MEQGVMEILNQILQNQTSMSEDINTIKSDIVSMKSDINSMKSDIDSMKGDIDSMKDDISTLQQDVGALKSDISTLQQDVGAMKGDISTLQHNYDSLQAQVAQNTLLLENTRKDIKIIIEVQKSQFEQNQREHQEILTTMNKRSDILEIAIKKTSTTVNEIIEDNKSFNEILGRHERAIETIKRKLAKTL